MASELHGATHDLRITTPSGSGLRLHDLADSLLGHLRLGTPSMFPLALPIGPVV